MKTLSQDHLTFTLVNYNRFISLNAQPAAGTLEDFHDKSGVPSFFLRP